MAESSLKNEMVVLRNECNVKAKPIYVQTITGVAGQIIRNAASSPGNGTTADI
jgi:hypothetical protein